MANGGFQAVGTAAPKQYTGTVNDGGNPAVEVKAEQAPVQTPKAGGWQGKSAVVEPWLTNATSDTVFDTAGWGLLGAGWGTFIRNALIGRAASLTPLTLFLSSVVSTATSNKLKHVSAAEAQQIIGLVQKPQTAAERDEMLEIFQRLLKGEFVESECNVRRFKLEEGVPERFQVVIDQLNALRF